MDENNYCTLYLVRHGETEWNANKIVMGQKDSPLTATGIQQAKQVRGALQHVHFDAVYSSDLLRAHRTAEIITLEKKLVIQTSRLLRERAYGRFEGKQSAEYKEAIKHLLDELQKLPEHERWNFKLGEDVESDSELVSRFITVLREIALAHVGKKVLIVTHGGCIRTFLMRAGFAKPGELPSGSFGNGGYVKVLSDGVDFFIKEVIGLRKEGDKTE